MSNSRIPSPARSLGVLSPRRYIQRRSRSVCSPGRVETSVKLTAMLSDTFAPSPLPKRRSVLNDDTEIIDMPQRKSWWRKLDENSRDVIELFEHKEIPETNNIEENFDVEILSQEKKNYTLDLPDSSDGESISSIVIPQRKLFTQKENHPPKKFPRVFNNREELVKLQKSHVDHDKEIDVRPRSLFNQGKKPKSKPIFPSALLNISANKSIANKTREIPTVEPKGQVRNLFGNRPGTKRKNMFADFVVSESEDEVPEIQAKIFGFQKKSEQKQRVSNAGGVEASPTASILDDDIDDWKQLPSSTMMDNQIEDVAATPAKRKRLSQFIEPKETASTDKSLNKSKRNESLRSHKSKAILSPQNIGEGVNINTSQIQEANQSRTLNKTLTNVASSKLSKTYNVEDETKGVQNKTLVKDNEIVAENRKQNETKNRESNQENQEPIENGSDGENDFTLEYENDEDVVEQVENEKKKGNETSLGEIQPRNHNKSSTHDRSSQAIPKDINKSKNKSNTTLGNTTKMNRSQNPKNSTNRDDSHTSTVNTEIKNTNKSIVKNQSIETNADKDCVKNKLIDTDKNQTPNSTDLVNNQNTENVFLNSNSLVGNTNNIEKNVNTTMIGINKSLHKLEDSKMQSNNEESEQSMINDEDNNSDTQNDENQDSSDESIQLDESETHNESQESENEKTENNQSSNEINETENDTNEEELSRKTNEIEQVLDEVDNIHENVNNFNKSDKNIESSKHNESKVDPPEAILFQKSKNFIDSFTGKDEGKSPRKTKSMFKNNLRPSLAPVRESTGFSDNTADSSGANSGWDSHRTTRKTLRKTFGKDFTPRKSLRTLVMEKSAKQRQTFNPDLHDISKHPRANSTELPDHGMDEPQEQLDDETVENIQHAIESNVFVKETPEGTENDIADDDHMETEESDNVNKPQENKENTSHSQSKEINDESPENLENEPSDNSKVESDDENDATEIKENSDHADITSDNDQLDETDHENNDTDNQQPEEESDNENDAVENQQSEEESDHEDDTVENQSLEKESDHEIQSEEESEHANDTSNQQTDHESDHNASINEEEVNQEVEESEDDQEHSDNDTRDNQFEESGYNNDEVSNSNIQENNTEINQTAEESNHLSKSMKQRTLEMYLEKINKQELERGRKLRENLLSSLKTKDAHKFKVPAIPARRNAKAVQKKTKAPPAKAKEAQDLPEEVKQDLKYKPPRRYQPKNAPWATMRLYKYLEAKLEPKYDYMARVRAEKLVGTLHEFTRLVRRHDAAPAREPAHVAALKQEMARLRVVRTHYEFYQFFHEFMPRDIRVKVNPDIVNKIQLPKDVFSDIIR